MNQNKDFTTENFTLNMQVHNLTKERDYYKEKAAEATEKYREAIAADLRNQEVLRRSKKRVAIRCLLVGAVAGAIVTLVTFVTYKM